MVSRSLVAVVSVALIALTGQAAVPLAAEEEVAFTVVVPNHAGSSEDHAVELYNPGSTAVELDGWEIHKFDLDHSFADTCSVSLQGEIGPQDLLTVENPHTWNACSWSVDAGELTLYDAEGALVSSVSWGEPGTDHEGPIPEEGGLERCFLVNPDGQLALAPHWEAREDPSLGSYNDPCLEDAAGR